MATVVPCASCYGVGKGPPRGDYMSLFMYRGPRSAPRPRLACHAPKMTLRQICHMLKVMKQVRNRDAPATASRKQGSAAPAPASPGSRSEKICITTCFRRRRSTNIKRVG